jgi:mannose-6-phosphate isomerase-like protein (cupin superfamily)
MPGKQFSPETVHIGTKARQLTHPYTGLEVAAVDDFGLSVFLCQGSIAWHQHVDEDEMFLTYSGAITIDSEMGPVFLRAGELTVVPKGIRHRSSSPIRSEVLIFQPRMLADRRNGDRRLYAVDEKGALSKINLYAAALNMPRPYARQPLVQVGDFDVHLSACEDTLDEQRSSERNTLLLVQQGSITLKTDEVAIQLYTGDTLVIPRDLHFSLSAQKRALLLEFSREVH